MKNIKFIINAFKITPAQSIQARAPQ